MHQIQFWHPAGEVYSAPRHLAGFKGPTSKGRGGERKDWMEGRGLLYFSLRINAHGVCCCVFNASRCVCSADSHYVSSHP